MTVLHVSGGSNVVALPGVRVRRRLPENLPKEWCKAPRPPKGRYGKAAQKKAQGYHRHPQHENKSFDDLQTWQQDAYWCRFVGQRNACLTEWELKFFWSVAAQEKGISWKQKKKLREIKGKVEDYERRYSVED